MTADASILDDIRASIQALLDLDKPAATRTASVLTKLLSGQTFETAAALPPGWHKEMQDSARAAALAGLLGLHPELDNGELADMILAGIERLASFAPDGQRPDGVDGYVVDLLRSGYVCGWRNWRRLVGEARGQRSAVLATAGMQVWSTSKLEE